MYTLAAIIYATPAMFRISDPNRAELIAHTSTYLASQLSVILQSRAPTVMVARVALSLDRGPDAAALGILTDIQFNRSRSLVLVTACNESRYIWVLGDSDTSEMII